METEHVTEQPEAYDWPFVDAWFGPMSETELEALGHPHFGAWALDRVAEEQALVRREAATGGTASEPYPHPHGLFVYGGHTFQNLMAETVLRSGPGEGGRGGLALIHGEDPESDEILAVTVDWPEQRVALVRFQGEEEEELAAEQVALSRDQWIRLHLRHVGAFPVVWVDGECVLSYEEGGSHRSNSDRRLALLSGSAPGPVFRNLRATELISTD
ncbi:hypothetical protein AN478_05970 [Thiohalorhabdus denitrificans]|uniref:3-keto-disaccharide hydrolase domain-containing protein n=1 Tax=Thiohalorhabdus denitrificans TaxID=381306 RepID=A0A0N8PN70_9GAMM|nr:hypothetical protein [Thiohalorhabdus denitrificans]KPV40701.1 hypothetical protein AN478_05970 [Thiohalorhabdus denitrificans]SCY46578.1 hypothetical protein SAMN05661077_2183 [Thiohalorhabdus denitrificans]